MTKKTKAGAKASAKSATKTKSKKPPKVKLTPEVVSDQQREMYFKQFLGKLISAEADKADITTEIKTILEDAKARGVPAKALKFAMKLKKEKGVAEAKADRELENTVARWLGHGKQLDLFKGDEIVAQRHFEDGRSAGILDQPARPPEHLNNKDAQIWLDGHSAGRTTLNLERAAKFRTQDEGTLPLGEAASNVIDTLADRKAA